MTQGLAVFNDIRAPVQRETRQLQQKIAVADGNKDVSMASCNSSGSSGSASDSRDTGLLSIDTHSSMFEHLGRCNQQVERLARMKDLLNKDFVIRTAARAFVLGCMTWPQIAKLFVLLSPYNMGIVSLAVALFDYQRELQQQSQQQ